jgi:hypothetical protein
MLIYITINIEITYIISFIKENQKFSVKTVNYLFGNLGILYYGVVYNWIGYFRKSKYF